MRLIRLFSKLPLEVLFVFSDFFYLLAYYVLGYRKKIVLSNIKHAFPEKSDEEVRDIARKFYRNFTDSMAETLKLLTMSEKELLRRFVTKNSNLVFDNVANGEIVIGMCGHFFNWEGHLVAASSQVSEKCETIYTKLNQPFFEKLMKSIRCRFGAILTEKKSFQRTFLRNRHQPRLIVLAADQRPNLADIRYWASFMNRETAFFEGGEKLAKKFNTKVIYAHTSKPKRGHYIFEYQTIAHPPYANDLAHSITDKFIALLENNIRDCPSLYLWSHNRWKQKKPKN
ncbi:lysophospholipid acyltransferase family protein [uncultured Cyclobacterium sp.]|uniref:lysophospholipid acyltransferase family protein n=1 Tax=uncultured Cyclobacterium sp. TaxID=453820 RepID=UPI0030EB258D